MSLHGDAPDITLNYRLDPQRITGKCCFLEAEVSSGETFKANVIILACFIIPEVMKPARVCLLCVILG